MHTAKVRFNPDLIVTISVDGSGEIQLELEKDKKIYKKTVKMIPKKEGGK